MNRGRILKMHPGRDANCSSEQYFGAILVGLGIYTFYSGIVFALLKKQWQATKSATYKGLWLLLQGLALVLVVAWFVQSGAMDYGSMVCLPPFVVLILIVSSVGVNLIGREKKTEEKAIDNQTGGDIQENDQSATVEERPKKP